MANSLNYSVLVNQKIAFASILLTAAEQLSNDTSIPSRQAFHAYIDSAVAQLNSALANFLIEIISNDHPQIKVEPLIFENVCVEVHTNNIDLPLMQELKQLKNKDSWLTALLRAKNEQSWLSELISASLTSPRDSNIPNPLVANSIPLVNVDDASNQSPLNLIKKCQKDLQSFIERHRLLTIED